MNPLTQIRNTQNATKAEIELGIGDKSSWHARFKHSAYVFTGGLPYELTEGDILAVFSQCGEVVDVHLVRDKKTGKSKGFAFLAYEDQRSTVLAVDNLSGARVAGRTIRVEHVDNYRKKRAEMEGEPIPEDSEDERQEKEPQRGSAGSGAVLREGERGERGGGIAEQGIAGRESGGGNVPWGIGSSGGGGNSIADILAQAKAQGLVDRPWKLPEGGARAAGGRAAGALGEDIDKGGGKKRGREKKEKKEKKDRKKERKGKHRSRSRSRSQEKESFRKNSSPGRKLEREGDGRGRKYGDERGGSRDDSQRDRPRGRSRSRSRSRDRSWRDRRKSQSRSPRR